MKQELLDLQLFGEGEDPEALKASYEERIQTLQQQLEAEKAAREAERIQAQQLLEAGEVQKQYPTFSLEQELRDQHFRSLVEGGMALRSAYEICHGEELLTGLREQLSAAARPRENGMGGQAASHVIADVAGLTRAQRREIIRRVQRGEMIRF